MCCSGDGKNIERERNINGQKREGKMLTFCFLLHIALKNWFQSFRQWRCYQDRHTRLSQENSFDTTQRTQKLESLVAFWGEKKLSCEKNLFSVFDFFRVFLISQSFAAALLNFTYFWSRLWLHLLARLRTKLKRIFSASSPSPAPFSASLRYAHAQWWKLLPRSRREVLFLHAVSTQIQCHEQIIKQRAGVGAWDWGKPLIHTPSILLQNFSPFHHFWKLPRPSDIAYIALRIFRVEKDFTFAQPSRWRRI